ncbi:hypothetical protein AB4Z55_18205 [Gordonia sp. ABKF26]|uniref:hypothetical protein n=1 Tax=Gordonia sp. ABKF26 TaxID=3238687 RepID=UPI0034E3E2D0
MDALDMASSYCMDILSLPTSESRADGLEEAASAVNSVLTSALDNFEMSANSSGTGSRFGWSVNPISGRTNVLAGLYDCGISIVRTNKNQDTVFAAISVPVMGRIYGSDGTIIIKRTRDSSTGHIVERVFEARKTIEAAGPDADSLSTGCYVYDAVLYLEGRTSGLANNAESPVDRTAVSFILDQ